MKLIMDDIHLETLAEVREFLRGSLKLVLRLETLIEKYDFIDEKVATFNYPSLSKSDKRIVVLYLKKFTGYKRAQLFRLIKRAVKGKLVKKDYVRTSGYHRLYTPADIKLIEKTDEAHLRLNAHATHEIMRREYALFHHLEFKNVANISISHIDNLRKSNCYKASWVNGTKARIIAIGTTTKPETNNCPGSIRIDTVHQRDVYFINAVDEITQWEIVACVPKISEAFLLPILELLLNQFPFIVFNFHSDRGVEFINAVVARLLTKLFIEQTKSRSRHCNDNALVESKNGSVIRKNMGYQHLNQNLANKMNEFYQSYFNPYLNFHRPCGYVTAVKLDFKGRERNIYGQYTTPYEKLKEISEANKTNFLKPGQTFAKLDIIAYQMSDNEFASTMRKRQNELFELNTFMEHNR